MAKLIKITEQDIEKLKQDFSEALHNIKMADGKITFSKTIGEVEQKATLIYSEIAWIKQQMLIQEIDKEVAWHGIIHKEGDFEYYVEDIMVYPQVVSGTTVNTDQEKYQSWLYEQDDDVFNKIRMQGHSHVNMSTTPSVTDTTWYEEILDQLDDSMFYVFIIWNKRGDHTVKIYDMGQNVLFENKDVDIRIADDGAGFEQFVAEAKEMVQTRSATTYGNYNKTQTNTNQYAPTIYRGSEDSIRKGKKKGKRTGYNYYDDYKYDYEGYPYYAN